MRRFTLLLLLLAVAAVSFLGVAFLSKDFPTVWLPLGLAAAVAAVLLSAGSRSRSHASAWGAMSSGGVLLWMLSEPEIPLRARADLRLVAIGLAVAAAGCLAALLMRGLSARAQGSEFYWATGLVLLSWLVSFFSSPGGSSGGMVALAVRLLDLSPANAELAVFWTRKLLHFGFYGTIAWVSLHWLLSGESPVRRAVLGALAMALAHACFDEGRQMFFPDRSSSGWDVILDMAGALAFVLPSRTTRGSRRA